MGTLQIKLGRMICMQRPSVRSSLALRKNEKEKLGYTNGTTTTTTTGTCDALGGRNFFLKFGRKKLEDTYMILNFACSRNLELFLLGIA